MCYATPFAVFFASTAFSFLEAVVLSVIKSFDITNGFQVRFVKVFFAESWLSLWLQSCLFVCCWFEQATRKYNGFPNVRCPLIYFLERGNDKGARRPYTEEHLVSATPNNFRRTAAQSFFRQSFSRHGAFCITPRKG